MKHKDNICKCNVLWLAEIIGAIVMIDENKTVKNKMKQYIGTCVGDW
jgi:hypothetical protein